jgi:hypothetical protein
MSHLGGVTLLIVPWDDQVWLGTLVTAIGDGLVIAGAAVAVWIYGRQSETSERQQRRSSHAHLRGVKAALEEWYDNFFMTSYEGVAASERAQRDYEAMLQGGFIQNYQVPTEPVSSLIQPAGDIWPFSDDTVRAANVALARITVFNQLVQKQTLFLVNQAAELARLDEEGREPIARAGMTISKQIHGIIDNADWYHQLKRAIEDNLKEIDEELAQPRASFRQAIRGSPRLSALPVGTDDPTTDHAETDDV